MQIRTSVRYAAHRKRDNRLCKDFTFLQQQLLVYGRNSENYASHLSELLSRSARVLYYIALCGARPAPKDINRVRVLGRVLQTPAQFSRTTTPGPGAQLQVCSSLEMRDLVEMSRRNCKEIVFCLLRSMGQMTLDPSRSVRSNQKLYRTFHEQMSEQ